jgi:microcystin-dependent protein
MVGFNFAPVNWAFCDGSTIPISENETLYNLIGTTYGGNGVTNFNLPNLLSRMPVHQGTGSTGTPYVIGSTGGAENVTLSATQLPLHTHPAACNATASAPTPGNNVWATTAANAYSSAAPSGTMNGKATSFSGGNQPHANLPPFLAINFIIALFGVYPSQS